MEWVKSSHSGPNGGDCVEWAPGHASAHGVIPVRDSKQTDGPGLMLSPEAFAGLIRFARNTEAG
ncbi:DUF397 domain-containing protein [Streptomyces sp. NPDC059477]|uniref:DUF397 domain-containing protein n=1 Tax=Streptomyces sp. NPDC059477 TaxID=3346847 RepID=UPI0036A25E3E